MPELVVDEEVTIPVEGAELKGALKVPPGSPGLVVFAHGSGSSRLSPRNQFVADVIRERGLGTLLFDLLTEEEDRVYENRFDIGLLTERLVEATRWSMERRTAGAKVGLFGSSTGAAAALKGAARLEGEVGAVVSRGGRVDIAEGALTEVGAPTLFIVGGRDRQVLRLNEEAYELLRCEKRLEVVEGAGHLFEEPGALERVAELAADWFGEKLGGK